MKYMVMECHLGYAVVLDSAGRFLKVANLHYQVGQTVSSVVEMNAASVTNDEKKKSLQKTILRAASLAACFCLVLLGAWQYLLTPYGSVRMQINPDVQMTVNRLDYVIALDSLNEDGAGLIDGYSYRLKRVDQVSDELADRALEKGYLKDGGAIALTVESEHGDWKIATEERLLIELEAHLGQSITITSDIPSQPSAAAGLSGNTVVIPLAPPEKQPDKPLESGGNRRDDDRGDGSQSNSSQDDGNRGDDERNDDQGDDDRDDGQDDGSQSDDDPDDDERDDGNQNDDGQDDDERDDGSQSDVGQDDDERDNGSQSDDSRDDDDQGDDDQDDDDQDDGQSGDDENGDD